MTFQYIINHLHEPHLWCIVLTAPHAELNIQKKLEQQGFADSTCKCKFRQ